MIQREKSCGAVIFTCAENEIRYVVIRHTGGRCGFPKGHMEPGEDEKTTALRESCEEVGLRPTLAEGVLEEENHPLHPARRDCRGLPAALRRSVFYADLPGSQGNPGKSQPLSRKIRGCVPVSPQK
ncbi:MAG: NUDIX domain-containing protein [Faecousia sp.]